jgi:PadR family transcriptional regulator, regulatory protein PadR
LKDVLGGFEHQVLLAALRLGGDAYAASIVQELEEPGERVVAVAAVHIALRRLETNGFVRSELDRRDGPGGVRERRYVAVTPSGLAQLSRSRQRLLRLWHGVEERLGGAPS